MAKYRRIGTIALQYGSPRGPDGRKREQEVVLSTISEAGKLGIDILLFQEEYGFTAHDPDSEPDRLRFAPAAEILPAVPVKTYAEYAIPLTHAYVERAREAARQAHV